jgi:lysophospholipase L1-like esterase
MNRILIRGGSIAAGYGVERGYAEVIRDWCAPRGIELINCSRPGENTFDGVRTFDEDIARFTPDILIIHFGIDDAFGCIYKSEFKENPVYIVRRAREQFSPVIIMTTSQPFESPGYMQPAYFYYQIIRDVCLDLGCEMVQVHSFWNGLMMEKGLLYADLVQENVLYPNERGHEIFAEAIVRRLEQIMAGKIQNN